MRFAFLFPGQGMEQPGMGLALAARSTSARHLLERACDVTAVDLFELLRRGGPRLQRTEVLQPSLTAITLGVQSELCAAGLKPAMVAGHSLGELAAWSATGSIADEVAVDLAGIRGRLMGREATRRPGGMLALLVEEEREMKRALAAGRRRGSVDLAARNAPGEWVLSGEHHALQAISCAWRSRPLKVSGAWHGEAMSGAVQELRRAIASIPRGSGHTPLVCNQTGGLADEDDLPDLLAEQLVRPVDWVGTLSSLASAGVTDYVTVGPGHVLRGLLRKNLGSEARVHTTEHPDDLARTIERLQQ